MKKLIAMLFCLFPVAAAAVDAPYRGEQDREIKALSAEQMAGYLAGKGMGMAKAAELNHYPGPMHVLQLADRLGLTSDQKARAEELKERMFSEARPLGADLVEQERLLDKEFAEGTIDEEKLRTALAAIGELSARIRFIHLQVHLEMRKVLSARQGAAYDSLRGYVPASEGGQAQ